ncbi:hypothetical protein 1 [Wuhan millipede virus 3]|uniref:hypothetical protein 1 n=1 Tax=Wuhan millipede virus 3 TaxID=1923742 RepID=UPI00090BDE44|nr:hypothetical protein 1 [Wuhan millipede virus 3]APG78449.1 hypothetical protein 1 [Wuhan millipede virus 3]
MATTTEINPSALKATLKQMKTIRQKFDDVSRLEHVLEAHRNQSKMSKPKKDPRFLEEKREGKMKTQNFNRKVDIKRWKTINELEYQHQIFDGIKSFFGKVNDFGDKIPEFGMRLDEASAKLAEGMKDFPETMQKANDATTTVSRALDMIYQLMETAKDKMTKISDGITGFFEQLKMHPYIVAITFIILIVLMTQPFKYAVVPLVLFIMYLLGWHEKIIAKVKQILARFRQQDGVTDSISIFGQIIFTILAFFGISQIPTEKFYETLIKRLDSIPKAFTGATKIWDSAGKAFEVVSDQFKITFLHYKAEDLIKEEGTVREIMVWSTRVLHYMQVPNRTSLSKDEEAVREVTELFNQMYRWQHTTSIWKSLPTESQRLILSQKPHMQDLFRIVCKSSVHEGGPRKAPISILFSGESGRGKSELLIPLAYALLDNRGTKTNHRNEIYVRNYETEYWDGYCGQKIVLFDDAFQMKDTPGNPSPEFMEAIRVNNTAPAHVHCADTNDKGRFFSSEICLYTTNLQKDFTRFIASMNCPEAAVRRLNMNAFRIITNPAYEKVIQVDGQEVRRLDPTLCGWSKHREQLKCRCYGEYFDSMGLKHTGTGKDPACIAHPCQKCKDICIRENMDELAFCPHHYLFQRYNMLTDESIGEPLDFTALLAILRTYDQNLVARETGKLDFYEKFASNIRLFEHQMGPNEEHQEQRAPEVDETFSMAHLYNFEDAFYQPGVVDLEVPEDALSFHLMQNFILEQVRLYGHERDFFGLLEVELSYIPALYAFHRRATEFGIININNINYSLINCLDAEEIVYMREQAKFYCVKKQSCIRLLYEWARSYLSRTVGQLTSLLDETPVTILLTNLTFFVGLAALIITTKNLFKSFHTSSKLDRLYKQEKIAVEQHIREIQEIYWSARPKQQALFGSCAFGDACERAPGELDHPAALQILSSMCLVCCPSCYKMSHDGTIAASYKFGFDAESQVYNANLLREYWRRNSQTQHVAQSMPIQVIGTNMTIGTQEINLDDSETHTKIAAETAASSANVNIRTVPLVKVEASASSANVNLTTRPQVRTEITPTEIAEKVVTGVKENHAIVRWIEDKITDRKVSSIERKIFTRNKERKLEFDNLALKALLGVLAKDDASHEMACGLNEEYWDQVNSGIKTVEIRKFIGKWQRLTVGEIMEIRCGDKMMRKQVIALSVNKLEELLRNCGGSAMPGFTLQEALTAYSCIYPDWQGSEFIAITLAEPENSSYLTTPKELRHEIHADSNGRQLVGRIMRNSLYALHDDKFMYGNVLFVMGTTALMPWHFIDAMRINKNRDELLYLSNLNGKNIITFPASRLDNAVRLQKGGFDTDAALVRFDPVNDKVHAHPKIIKSFVSQSNLKNFPESSKFFAILSSYRTMSTLTHFIPSMISCNDVGAHFDATNTINIDGALQQYKYRDIYAYFSDTQFGDCGAPLVLQNVNSDQKILGIHVAGQDNGVAFSQCITAEMIQEGIAKMPFAQQIFTEPYEMIEEEIPLDAEREGSVPMGAGLNVIGKMAPRYNIRGATKTKITPSVFFDKVTEHKTMPTVLRKDGPAGDPMERGLLKFGKSVPWIQPTLIKVATNDVENNYNINACGLSPQQYRRKLDYCEAVCGVPDDEYMAPINRGTSLGFPYVVDWNHPNGKREAFGTDEWKLDTPQAKKIERDVMELEDKCRRGEQAGVYWTDTLKDERRPLEKVKAGKTRVFCAGPVHFTILFRMYFLGFAAWIMRNRNSNEISTGTNVYSYDWNNIARKLRSRGLDSKGNVGVVAGDFENFDGSLSSQILWAIFESIQRWYNDGEENEMIRRTLWAHLVHAVHVNEGTVYSATHSQPSGCPITAILNSIYNSIVIRIVYLLAAEDFEINNNLRLGELANMEKFNQFVACVSYGDDNLIAICEMIREWFNQIIITEKFKQIGHVYTDERKTGEIYTVRSLSEVAFLKRKFVWSEMAQRFIAPLDIDVVLEIVQWTKRGMQKDEITLANIEVCMRELSLHGENVYNLYKNEFKHVCAMHGINFRFLTWHEVYCSVLELPLYLHEGEVTPLDLMITNEWVVHCISADAKMSRGFAKALVAERMTQTEVERLKKAKHEIGDVIFCDDSKTIHLVTKNLYWHKPRNTFNFERALKNLNIACRQRGIGSVSMPPMQCGLDAKYTHLKIWDLEKLLTKHLTDVAWTIFA